ncbi:hypothetical protein KEM54_005181 [Ascosphaera aggregata]|nr:hypothetical protein KEM54_005181 [Ascosphaera aggregata]
MAQIPPPIPISAIDNQDVAVLAFSRLRNRIDLSVIKDKQMGNTPVASNHMTVLAKLPWCKILSFPPRSTPDAQLLARSLRNLNCILASTEDDFDPALQAAVNRGIEVIRVKAITDDSGDARSPGPRAQHSWGLILALSRHIARDDSMVKRGGWQGTYAMSLPGKTLGLIGFDLPGQSVAYIGVTAFAMKVKVWSTKDLTQDMADCIAGRLGLPPKTFEVVSKEDLLRSADVISLHEDLPRENVSVIGEAELAVMKRTTLLVNISRAALIDYDALYETLVRGKIRGAALDTFRLEPLPQTNPWRTTQWGTEGRSEVILTPNVAYAEIDTVRQYYEKQAAALERWLDERGL